MKLGRMRIIVVMRVEIYNKGNNDIDLNGWYFWEEGEDIWVC